MWNRVGKSEYGSIIHKLFTDRAKPSGQKSRRIIEKQN